MAQQGFFPNVLHNDKWKITFSNIPTLDDMSEMKYFDNYVKSCSVPSYHMGDILSQLPMGMQIRHPLGGMKRNQELDDLVIKFKVSEDMYNYFVMFSWIQQLRYGQINPNHEDYFRKYSIKKIIISMLDNQKRTVAELEFTNVLMGGISALDLSFGATSETEFDCTFKYEEVFYTIKNPMEGGRDICTPMNAIECGTSGVPLKPDLEWTPHVL